MDYTTKFLKGRQGPEAQPFTLLFTIHGRKGYPWPIIISSTKSTYLKIMQHFTSTNLKVKSMGDGYGRTATSTGRKVKTSKLSSG